MITLQELQTDPKYRSMSREELANIINGNDFLWNDYLQLEGSFSDDKAANLIASWKAKEDNKIQEGATIYAINECIMKGSENPTLTIGKGYVVQYIESSKYFSIIDDKNETHVFYLTEFNKYFSFYNPNPMRTIKLTHEQIQLLTEALGIAEGVYSDIHKDILHKVVHIRGNEAEKEQKQIADYYYVKGCNFADMNEDIKDGIYDV